MTTVDSPSEPSESVRLEEFVDSPAAGVQQLQRRRRPAPKANPFWRFVFPVIVIAAGVAVVLLARHGAKVILESTDGELVDIITDPAQPGFEAFVDPTPTMLLAHIDGEELIGVTVLAQTLLEDGGQVVLVSSDLLITSDLVPNIEPVTLADAYQEGGLGLVEELVASMFGFGFLETAEFPTRQLGAVMALVEPIPFGLVDDLRQETGDGETELWLSRGQKELDGLVAAEVYAFLNPNEPDANRNERQLDLWVGWVREISRADDLLSAAMVFDTGVSPYLRAFGGGSVDVVLVPAEPVFFDDERPLYQMDETHRAWLAELARRMVPLPISPPDATLPRIRLLNGTDDPARRDSALDSLIDIGVEVAVIGNASEFGVERSVVLYHQAADQGIAEELAASIGASVEFVEDLDLPVDLTVVVGADWEMP